MIDEPGVLLLGANSGKPGRQGLDLVGRPPQSVLGAPAESLVGAIV